MATSSVVTAIVVSSSQINLSWTAIDAPMGYAISSYSIFRNGVAIKSVPATQTSFQDIGLTAATTYSYYIQAVVAINSATAASSNTVSATSAAKLPTWNNSPFASQTGSFVVTFNATPTASGSSEDAVVGLSAAAASSFSGLAAIIRFANESSGNIDVRNGGAYGYSTALPYVAGATYAIRMEVNIQYHTYSIYVTKPGGTATLIADNYAFRSEQVAVTSLANICDYSPVGGVTISDVTVAGSVASVPPPLPPPSSTVGTITNFTKTPGSYLKVGGVNHLVEGQGNTYSITNPDPVTLRFEVHKGDRWAAGSDGSYCERSELQDHGTGTIASWGAYIPANRAIDLNYKFMVEANSGGLFINTQNSSNGWFCIGQMHNDDIASGVGTSPPFTFEMQGNRLAVALRYVLPGQNPSNGSGNVRVLWSWVDPNPIVTGVYRNISSQMKFSQASGYCIVSVDGVQVVNYSGPLGFGVGTYWEYGIYRSTATEMAAVLYRNMSLLLP